jgi:dephospho-CoA kinase
MVKIIITTGLSAAGKSTISRMVANRLSLPVVHATDMMRKYAKSKGYDGLVHFFIELGYQKGYETVRPMILNKVKNYAKKHGAVFDGIHDYVLYKKICEKYGRENIRVIAISAARKYRVDRHADRRKLTKEKAEEGVDKRDQIAIAGGTLKIVNDCDFKIKNEGSLEECVQEIIKHV